MNENHTAETVEIKLDTSKLLGFQMLTTLGEDAADLRKTLDDTHNKIGEVTTGSGPNSADK